MADERVDPFEQLTPFALDHLTRYLWARTLIPGGRVLDAACGTGFGCRMLAEGGKRSVLGVDICAEAVEAAWQRYGGPGVAFAVMDLMAGPQPGEEPFDAIVSFETLEHLPDPDKALALMASLLKPGGLLLASVPGEGDAEDDNPYHLQHFTRASLATLAGKHFAHVRYLTQEFGISSYLRPEEGKTALRDGERLDERSSLTVCEGHEAGYLLDAGREPAAPPDTRLLVASTKPLKFPDQGFKLESREVWCAVLDELRGLRKYARTLQTHTDELQGKYSALQAHNENLQVHADELNEKFGQVLGWGTFYKNLAKDAGIDPEEQS